VAAGVLSAGSEGSLVLIGVIARARVHESVEKVTRSQETESCQEDGQDAESGIYERWSKRSCCVSNELVFSVDVVRNVRGRCERCAAREFRQGFRRSWSINKHWRFLVECCAQDFYFWRALLLRLRFRRHQNKRLGFGPTHCIGDVYQGLRGGPR
jgi:hypothetical protein